MFIQKSCRITAIVAAVAALALPTIASAGLVYDSSIQVSGAGFGNLPKDLTLQVTGGGTTPESGCVGYGAGGITFGTCVGDTFALNTDGFANTGVFMGNLVVNESGTADMPSPLMDAAKYGAPTTASLGIDSASDIGIIFNATEPGGDSITITDLTLKFYNAAGAFGGAIDTIAGDTRNTFANTIAGLGQAGFTYRIDEDQLAFVDGLLAGGYTTMALEASLIDFAGGEDTFRIHNIGTVAPPIPEPQTYALMLAGLGAVGFMARRRRQI